jgi:predicted nuclease with RNAse H fold
VLAVGIDVAEERKGLDLVALDLDRQVVASAGRLTVTDAVRLTFELSPVLVCIDSPSQWSTTGRSRSAERELARRGMPVFFTPPDPGDHPFYRWMRVGIELYRSLESRYPLLQSTELEQISVEAFPAATARILAGAKRPSGESKIAFRRRVLAANGVKAELLPNADRVDAALAALTGVLAIAGTYETVGDPGEGVILLPVRRPD